MQSNQPLQTDHAIDSIGRLSGRALVLCLCLIPLVPLLQHFGNNSLSYQTAALAAIGGFIVVLMLHLVGGNSASFCVSAIAFQAAYNKGSSLPRFAGL